MIKCLKTLGCTGILLASFLGLTACHQKEDAHTISVGTIAGPETTLMEVAKKVAKKRYGLTVNIITFTDYIEPNTALNDGSIDSNMFQHKPYLDMQMAAQGYKFTIVGRTFIYPMGIYSHTLTSLKALKPNSIVAIPNDPSNEGRALLLLQKAKLITLKPGASTNATPNDIVNNPLHLRFRELDAAQLPRALDDVAIAAINTNYAVPAGLSPAKNALFVEDRDSPYANLLVVRTGEQQEKKVQELMAALHSKPVLEAAKKIFHGTAIPAWHVQAA